MLFTVKGYGSGDCKWCRQTVEEGVLIEEDQVTWFLCKTHFWSWLKAQKPKEKKEKKKDDNGKPIEKKHNETAHGVASR